MSKQLIKISEAAVFLNMSTSRLRYEIFKQRIPCYKIGRSIRFKENELNDWILTLKREVKSDYTGA